MNVRLTLFSATLVQDSALSVSGFERESSADQPFALVDGVPTLVGRGLKGAAVAMARRFFDELPRSVSGNISNGAPRRSTWEFADATLPKGTVMRIRAGVGIRQKTGARAENVLYNREVIPSGTKWDLRIRVDWSYAESQRDAAEAQGILGYVLARHWAEGRCWLGGGVARGLGWCHIEDLCAYCLDVDCYERWVASGRSQTELPPALKEVPTAEPTRSWCFRTLDVDLAFGEYRPKPDEAPWGLDMLAVGADDSEGAIQALGSGHWARPSWASVDARTPERPQTFNTDRAILMEGSRPVLPGSSVRGPLRHEFSRAKRAAGCAVEDPHCAHGSVSEDDPAGRIFGTTAKSSRVLIRDGRAEGEWMATKLHMHAEDEFSAGSFGSAKRDAVRVMKGTFPIRIVVDGAEEKEVEELVQHVDRLVKLGALGHLPVGGQKTRGVGWGRWRAKPWIRDDDQGVRAWDRPKQNLPSTPRTPRIEAPFINRPEAHETWVRTTPGTLQESPLTLAEAARKALFAFGTHGLIAWWCEPKIDLTLADPPATFGVDWPLNNTLGVEEVAFYAECAVWRAICTDSGARFVFIEEVSSSADGSEIAKVVFTPARLHASKRFSSANTGRGDVLLREWHVKGQSIGFTIGRKEH